MAAQSSTTALRPVETSEDRECQRLGCRRQNVDLVRFAGNSTQRALCGRCKREYLGVSS